MNIVVFRGVLAQIEMPLHVQTRSCKKNLGPSNDKVIKLHSLYLQPNLMVTSSETSLSIHPYKEFGILHEVCAE